jgi:hypothetical protein
MISAALVVVVSLALLLFYVQSACQDILGRRFEGEYYLAIVNANHLEFPFVRAALEEYEAPIDYARFRMQLKCDFLALLYLLKNAANKKKRLSTPERMLAWYFRISAVGLGLLHRLGLGERPLILRMTSILQYFANVLGQRLNSMRFGDLPASEYLLGL